MQEQLRVAVYFVIVFGVLLFLASLFADPLGLGLPGSSFGWKQLLGTIVGLAIAAGGVAMLRRLERRE